MPGSRAQRRTYVTEPEQLVLFKKRGGKRRGAGRPPKGSRAGSPHKARPELCDRYPVHVTLRIAAAVGNLRRRCVYQAIREATLTTARREDFRIVHLSIQRTHVHLLVEADDKGALARGLQGFQISAAKHLNAAISKGQPGPRRRGVVFPDRYHAEIITSPRQARHAIAYCLNNFRKHREDLRAPMSEWTIDWFSSALAFPGWAEYGDDPFLWRGPATYDPLIVYQPRTWLLREGWKKSGSISCRETPSANHRAHRSVGLAAVESTPTPRVRSCRCSAHRPRPGTADLNVSRAAEVKSHNASDGGIAILAKSLQPGRQRVGDEVAA